MIFLGFINVLSYIIALADGNKTVVISNNARIVIVGAGISGLAAADKLVNEYGFTNVTVLEGLDRIGGRIHPVPYKNGMLQMGAEWIHGEENSMYELALGLGALAEKDDVPEDENEHFYTQSGCEILEPLKSELKFMVNNLTNMVVVAVQNASMSNTSLGQLYEKIYQNYTSADVSFDNMSEPYYNSTFGYLRKSMEIENGCGDWNRMSARQYSEYTETVGDSAASLGPTGYKMILDYFIANIPSQVFRLNTTVVKIEKKNNLVTIVTNGDEVFYADHVIVTSSIGYLKENAKNLFDPPLSDEKLNTINALGYDTVGKVFLIYDEPFWGKNYATINFLRNENDSTKCSSGYTPQNETTLSKIFFYFEPKPFYNNVLCAFVDGAEAELMESSSDEQIVEAATIALEKFMNRDLPKPTKVIKSSWHSNPLFRGSYSYYSVECDRINCQRKTLQEPVSTTVDGHQIPVILFAGEATSEHEYQTTHGAMKSGQREAERLNEFYKTAPVQDRTRNGTNTSAGQLQNNNSTDSVQNSTDSVQNSTNIIQMQSSTTLSMSNNTDTVMVQNSTDAITVQNNTDAITVQNNTDVVTVQNSSDAVTVHINTSTSKPNSFAVGLRSNSCLLLLTGIFYLGMIFIK